jgi:hypothetical protein
MGAIGSAQSIGPLIPRTAIDEAPESFKLVHVS